MTSPHAESSAKVLAQPSSFYVSTDAMPAQERVPFCQDVIGRYLLNVDIDLLSEGPLHYNSSFHTLPGLSIAAINASPARGVRTRELIARTNADEVIFTVTVQGTQHITWPGHDMNGAAGEAALLPSFAPGASGWTEPGSFLMYGIPVDLLRPLVPNVEDSLYRRVTSASEPLRLLVDYTGLMLRSGMTGSPPLRQTAATHLRDLIALALGATRDGVALAEEGGLRAARLQAIKAEVSREAASPELSIDRIARRHRLSPRSIQLLFETEGLTFSQFVLDQRLMLAHRTLSNWQSRHRSITDIALGSGFSNVSYFNRTFRSRFGASPSELRARHMN